MNSRPLAFALAVLSLSGFGILAGLREPLDRVSGDEATYLAMAASLAEDGDLLFDEADRERVEAASDPGSRVLILQRTADGISYSKPVVYALAAAPFYRLLGDTGPVVLNALALVLATWLTVLYLRRLGRRHLMLTLVTFLGASALVSYLVWRMSDALQVAMSLAGLVLCLAAVRRSRDRSLHTTPFFDRPAAPFLGGALLALVAVMRYPNALLGVAAVGALLLTRQWKRATLAAAGAALAAGLALGASMALTGTVDPYRTTRATFHPGVSYPTEATDAAAAQFDGPELATVRLHKRIRPRVVAYSALYFFVGRHTGLLFYFPAAVIFVLLALRRPDRVAISLLLAVAGVVLFYLLLLPHNYFGGGAAVGNRYFLTVYPALLVAVRGLPGPRWLLPPWILAAAVFGSAVLSTWRTAELAPGSQSHVHAGLLRWLPYESTLQSIEGSEERFWLHDWEWEMLHFNDPFSRVGGFSFFLDSASPAAEIEVANTRRDGVMRFLVLSAAPKLLLDYRDWRRSQTFELDRPRGERGLVEIVASPPWRAHPLWFHWRLDDVFYPRLFRLGLRTPDGTPASAELRYLGPVELPREIYAREVLSAELPTRAAPGTASRVRVRVRNLSSEVWKSDRVLAVYLAYKLYYRRDGRVVVLEGPRTPLPGAVRPGQVLDGEMEVHWPEPPRNYGLAVDLVFEGVAWFEEHNGSPLARSEVLVTPEAANRAVNGE